MKCRFLAATAAVLAVSLMASYGQTSETKPLVKKHVAAKKAKTPPSATVAEQLQALRHDLESQAKQIDGLKNDLEAKDTQLKRAEQAATAAQAAAVRAEEAVSGEQRAATENAAAVSTLATAVSGLKTSQSALAATVTDETAKIKKAVESPTVLRYKGATFTPYGFLAGESVYRTHATGGEMPTPFSSIPYESADSYSLSETYLSGRQSRAGLIVEGKTNWGTMRGVFEGDFFGVGTTSNNVQSSSYLFRQRVLMAEVETNSHWSFSGGQGWTLAAENKKGISTAPANIALPVQIDPNYVTGLVWSRGGNFRLTKGFNKATFAVSVENPQLQYTASLAGNTPYAVLGSAGVNSGLLNASISSCSPSTSIVNYTNQASGAANDGVPVYKTVNSCANLANISFNEAPDVQVKAAFDPGFGHYELFGIGRFAHETVYPGETTNSYLYGGLKDVTTGLAVAPALSSAGSFTNSIVLGGIGGSLRVPVGSEKYTFGVKGLYGPGVGRYGDSTLADLTTDPTGRFAPIHNASGLLTLEASPTPRLMVYLYAGGDYAGRTDFATSTATSLAAPNPCFLTPGLSGCQNIKVVDGKNTYPLSLPSTLTAAEVAAGKWGGNWAKPSAAAVGYGSRKLSNAACHEAANPTYSGSSTGFYSGAGCGAQTRDIQEVTGGYWYDIFKGDRGRLRQGVQYGYTVREGWSGVDGVGAKGIENMFFTSFRYYLP
jgi:hypothetical protein